MYAVVRTGGKQYRVEAGQTLEVELVGDEGETLELETLMLVDEDDVRATPSELSKAKVMAKVTGRTKGPKITGFTYKNKSNQRRHWGHRQHYSTIEITNIQKG